MEQNNFRSKYIARHSMKFVKNWNSNRKRKFNIIAYFRITHAVLCLWEVTSTIQNRISITQPITGVFLVSQWNSGIDLAIDPAISLFLCSQPQN